MLLDFIFWVPLIFYTIYLYENTMTICVGLTVDINVV